MILSVDARNKVLDFFRVLYKNFNLEKKNSQQIQVDARMNQIINL